MNIKFWAMVLVLLAGLAMAQTQSRQVEVDGAAAPAAGQEPLTVRQLALDDALRNAVEIGVGVFIDSQTEVKNFELIEDKIYKRASGFAKLVRIIQEGAVGGEYRIKILAEVNGAQIAQTLRDTIQRFNDPRVAVYLTETVDGKNTGNTNASTELSKQLLSVGFRVLDQATLLTVANRQELEAAANGSDAKVLLALKNRIQADLILIGSAKANKNPNPPTVLTNAGLVSYPGVLEYRLIQVSDAQIIGGDTRTSTGLVPGMSPEVVSSTTLKLMGSEAAPVVLDTLKKWIAKAIAPPVLTIEITGFKTFTEYNSFVQNLRLKKGVLNVQTRGFDIAGVSLEVEFDGGAETFAVLLETMGLIVTDLNGVKIKAKKP
jgi:hypothetical protein